MRILLVNDQFFAANNGMTISARRFAKALEALGHEVRVASTGAPGDTPYRMETFHVPFFDKLVTQQGMTFARIDDALLREAVSWADVVHLLMPFPFEKRALQIARELGKPYTAAFHVQPENISSSVHLKDSRLVNNAIYAWFDRYFYRHCDLVHCPSEFIAEQLRSHGYKNRLRVISNGIDPDFSFCRRPKDPEYEGQFIVMMTGRYSIEKRQDVLIDAVARSRYADRIRLVLAGQGPRRDFLARRAAKLPVPPVMRFFPHEELIRMLAQADLYVHAADIEIEAMACMEAFACGRVPVIADSPRSATPQFSLDEKCLFPAGDAAALAERIDWWLSHPEERSAMERRYAESASRYALKTCVQQAEAMFLTAIEDKKAR